MTSVSYRAAWQADYAKERESYIQILSWDPFRDWERNTAPESSAETALWFGLNILCGRGDSAQALRFLEQCLRIAERTMAEGKLESDLWNKSKFPQNRGELFRVRTYARALLGGPLDEGALQQAAADFEEFTLSFSKRWSDYEEAFYLVAVRLALLGGDRERADRILKRWRVMRWHKEEHALLKSLVDGPQPPPPQPGSPLLARVDVFFDRIRDPKYKPEGFMMLQVLRPEWAALRDKYFVSPDGRIDFRRVVEAIAR